MQKRLTYTAQEAARAANVSMPTIYAWTKIKGFPVVRVGRKVVVPIDAYNNWLENRAKTMDPMINDADQRMESMTDDVDYRSEASEMNEYCKKASEAILDAMEIAKADYEAQATHRDDRPDLYFYETYVPAIIALADALAKISS